MIPLDNSVVKSFFEFNRISCLIAYALKLNFGKAYYSGGFHFQYRAYFLIRYLTAKLEILQSWLCTE